ncbi:16S rRNA (cytosine(967)-C(5))-methyltransferase RsmB [Vulgatibacter incomptus]|uniref:16S rRNA (cytosine(967)-C(5))-methyltransferase n=1 Tax=Vulgatibacter incomptus TaxID=1391653 RepID=A0A0K1PHB4_9BACT|nr:16S rRNA (cytosine(967)-C(5))-methyltransferase RsmB [Vulgatibacter incomptus]AKU92786.1 Ribosomal RNA small subunit methyltransferase B [Vulgatibacter incomptus]
MSDPRAIALSVLHRVRKDAAFANLALDAELSSAGRIDPRDAALATELAYGVLRRRSALDRALSPLVKQPLPKLEPQVLELLRLGAYQLLYTRVPPHAAVGETVSTARRAGLERAAGLVNAVLRRLSQQGAPPPLDRQAAPLEALQVEASIPEWLAMALLKRLGADEAFELAEAIDRPAPPTIRRNRLRIDRDALVARLEEEAPGAEITAGAYSPDALRIEGAGPLPRLAAFRDGLFSQQDEAAQLVTLLADPQPGAKVLDACAAPGGKSCHLAELGAASVTSLDVHERKVRRIGEEAARLGLSVIRTIAADAGAPLPPEVGGPFDLVLVDAPCTGLGTLRRHPELRYRRGPDDVARMVAGQARILDNIASSVRVGGILVYAVCSFLHEEGRGQVDAFLERHRGRFEPAPLEPRPTWSPDGWTLETWPHRGGMDGFFAARLVRRA